LSLKPAEKPMLTELSEFVREHCPPHLRRLWGPWIGTQVLFTDGKPHRIPYGGKTPDPTYNDYKPLSVEKVLAVGVNGWDWPDGVSRFVTLDIDSVVNHATTGLAPERLDEIVQALMAVPEVELIRSKSGHGIHARIYFAPYPLARTHTDHAHNGARALAWLARTTGLPLDAEVDACGAIAWIWHRDADPVRGFQLLKEAT